MDDRETDMYVCGEREREREVARGRRYRKKQ
jgi:hypothetical protein